MLVLALLRRHRATLAGASQTSPRTQGHHQTVTDDDDILPPEMPCFDEAGRPVGVVQPIYETSEPLALDAQGGLTLRDVFDLLLYAAQDDHEIAGRVSLLGYLMKSERAPKTLAELGARLGISRQAAFKRLTTFRRKCAEILTSEPR